VMSLAQHEQMTHVIRTLHGLIAKQPAIAIQVPLFHKRLDLPPIGHVCQRPLYSEMMHLQRIARPANPAPIMTIITQTFLACPKRCALSAASMVEHDHDFFECARLDVLVNPGLVTTQVADLKGFAGSSGLELVAAYGSMPLPFALRFGFGFGFWTEPDPPLGPPKGRETRGEGCRYGPYGN